VTFPLLKTPVPFLDSDGQEKTPAIGAHYTTEQNILKIIQPLFLDELQGELEPTKGGDEIADKLAR
jgi:hypothetical protein